MSRKRRTSEIVLTVLIWLAVWQIAAMWIDNKIFLPSLFDTAKSLKGLLFSTEFYQSIGTSLGNIAGGFLLGIFSGTVLAVAAAAVPFLETFLSLPIRVIKATPVASFTILALFWMKSTELSILVSFFMVLPVIYTNVLTGIRETDQEMLEMAKGISDTMVQPRALFLCPGGGSVFAFGGFGCHRTGMEIGNCGRGHRTCQKFHRKSAVSGKNLYGDAGFVCLDRSHCCNQCGIGKAGTVTDCMVGACNSRKSGRDRGGRSCFRKSAGVPDRDVIRGRNRHKGAFGAATHCFKRYSESLWRTQGTGRYFAYVVTRTANRTDGKFRYWKDDIVAYCAWRGKAGWRHGGPGEGCKGIFRCVSGKPVIGKCQRGTESATGLQAKRAERGNSAVAAVSGIGGVQRAAGGLLERRHEAACGNRQSTSFGRTGITA